MKKIIMFLFITLLLVNLASALTFKQSQFTTNNSKENVSLGSSQDSLNVSINKDATIINATIDLQAFFTSITTTFNFTSNYYNMTAGCIGEIGLAPTNVSTALDICLNNGSDISGSCYRNISAVINKSNNLIHTNLSINISPGTYNIKINWRRIHYENMNNSGINGFNDSGLSRSGLFNDTCNDLSCGGTPGIGSFARGSGCSLAGGDCIDGDFLVSGWSAASCGGSETVADNPVRNKGSSSCRVYESFDRTGGADASGSCMDFLSYTRTGPSCNEQDVSFINCVEGTPSSCPSSVCTNAGDTTVNSVNFIINNTIGSNPLEAEISSSGSLLTNGTVRWAITPLDLKMDTDNDGSIDYTNSSFNRSISTLDLNVSALQACVNTCSNPDGNNCICEIKFNSTTTGILQVDISNSIHFNDSTTPQFSANNTNNTVPKINEDMQFNITITDGVNISHYIFSWDNGTDTFVNDTAVSLTAITNITVSINKTVERVQGTTMKWKWYANDTSGNWNNSGKFSLTVTNTLPLTTDLTFPLNSTYRNDSWNNFTFNSSDADNDTITYTLYADNNTNPTSVIYNSTNAFFNWTNLNESNTYYWKVQAHDGVEPPTSNSSIFNFTVDTIPPAMNTSAPLNGSSTSVKTITLVANITDTRLDACWFNITKTASGDLEGSANRTAACADSTGFTVDLFTDYTINLFALDLAANINSTTIEFTTAEGAPGGGGGGGGGGRGITETIIITAEICGNAICEEGEGPITCSADCKVNLDVLLSGELARTAWFARFIIFSFLGLSLLIFVRRQLEIESTGGKNK